MQGQPFHNGGTTRNQSSLRLHVAGMQRYGADSEGEFLGESFGDKEDLDRFKIPIFGVSRGVDPFLLSSPRIRRSREALWIYCVERGNKTVFLKFSHNRFSTLFSVDTSIKFQILISLYMQFIISI